MAKAVFLEINGVRTPVLTYGKWVEEDFEDIQDLIVVIPGNPGHTGFYRTFMETLHEQTGFPVWMVGHAGHEMPDNNKIAPIPPLRGHEALYGLKGQGQHKRDFVEKYIPKNTKIHLIGHSVGSYMILELLKDKVFNSKVVSVNLLFPAIEYMAETPNGKMLANFVKPIVWLIIFFAAFFMFLPTVIRNFLILCYMKIAGVHEVHLKTIVQFVNPHILEKVFFLAFEELDQMKERNNKVIKENYEKINFVYGDQDGWAPQNYCDRLKKDIPECNTHETHFNHAFVLRQSKDVGEYLLKHIPKTK